MKIYDDIRNHYTIMSPDLFLPDLFYQLVDIRSADIEDPEIYKTVLELAQNYNYKKILLKEKKVNGKFFHAEWRIVYGELQKGKGSVGDDNNFTTDINKLIEETTPYFNFFARAKVAPLPQNQEIPIQCLRTCNYDGIRNIMTPEYVSAFVEQNYPQENATDFIIYVGGLVIPASEYFLQTAHNLECFEEPTPVGMGTDTGYLKYISAYQMEYRNELTPTPELSSRKSKTASKKTKKNEEPKITKTKLSDFSEGKILEVLSPKQYDQAIKEIISVSINEYPEFLQKLIPEDRIYTCRYSDGMNGTRVGRFIYRRVEPYEEVLPFYFLKDNKFLHGTPAEGQSLSYISNQPDQADNTPEFAVFRTLHKLEYNSASPKAYYALFLIDEEGCFIMQPPLVNGRGYYYVDASDITPTFKNIMLREFRAY